MVAAAALVLVAMAGYGQSEPVVTVAATRSTAIAALDAVSFKLTRAGATAAALTVTVDLSQTREYLTSTDSQTVTFSAGSSTANLFFGISRFSSTVSGSGTLTATMAAGTGYAVGEPGAASVSMSAVSGTAVAVKLSAASYSFSEGAAAADRSVTVVAEMAAGLPASAPAIGVTLRSSEVSGDGAATSGTDFTALSEQVSIAPSAFSAQNGRQVARVTQALAITDDTEVEEDESLTVALRATPATPGKVGFSNPDGTACSGFAGTCTATVTIADNDVAPVLALAVSPANIKETGATTKSTITVSSSNAATFEVDQTIGLSFAGTATKDTDYTIANETLTLEAGDASVATTVTALSDSVDDGGETIIVTATHGSSTIGTKTITIDRPGVTLALSAASITEDGGTSQVTATVVPASPTAFTVALTAEPGSGTDFSLSSPATLSFAPAAGASSNTVTITAVDNDVDAANKTVTITGSVSIQGVGAPVARTLTIADDDVRGVSVSASSLTVAEGGSEDYTVVLDSEPTEAVTVGVARSSGSDSDVSVSPSTLTFGAADWSVAQPVTVSAQSDADTSNDSATIEHTVTGGDYGANSVTAASVAVTVPDSEAPPGQVTGLILTPGVGRLAVSWNAVTNADGYRVQWKSGSQSYNTSDRQRTITSGTTTSYTITGLTADTEYSVRVTATRTDAADGTPASATATPRAPAPGQVTGATLTAGVGQVTVSWSAVTDADGYKVQWKSGDQSYNTSDRQHPITSGTTTSYTITGLTAGTAYKVQVRATRANAADGEPSAPQTATAQFAAPAQVTGVTLTAGIGQVTVSWSAVTDANGYKVQWKSGDQSYNTSDRQHPITSGTTTSYAITSLTAGTAYTVQVRATRANAADGEPSAPQTATARAAAPAKVTNVVATPKVEALTISWTAVTNANGYKVQWKSGEEMYDETDRQRTVSSGFTTTDTIPGLDPAKTYTVQVIATRQHATDGPASDPATGRPRAAAAAQVTGVRLTVGIRQLDVSWTAVTNADGYKVQWKSVSQSYGATRQRTVVGGSTTSDTIPGLTPGTEYSVQVIATRDNADDGQPSSGAKATPRAEAPGQVTGVSVTTEVRGLAVTWTAATNADGYRVQWKSGAQTYNETDRQHVITDAATSYTIPSLDPDTNYTIRVTATRLHADDGRPSAEQTGRPLTTPPAKVTGLVLTREVRALGVTWSTATDADGYKVQWKSGEETYNETDRQRTVSDGATTSDTIPGLTPGTPYTVQVIATRDNAPDGMSSDQQTAIPKAEPPAQVTGVSVTLQVEALAVTWSVATDADGYKVQWKAPGEVYGSAREQRILGGQTTAYTIPGLDHTVTYSLQVIAMRDYSDDGVASAEAMGRPRAPAPAAVTGVEVVPGVRQLAVTWNAVTDADGYRVQWKSGTQSFSTTERRQVVASGGTTSYTIPNLDEDTTYTLQVTATRDNAADGPASGPATGRPKTDPPGRSDFLGTNEADTSVELLFREAANADGYKVQWKPQGGEYHSTRERTVTPAELRRLGSSILSYTITGLRPGTTYTFRVVAVRDNADDSQPSVEHTRRTLGERPEGRTDVSVTPQVEALDVSWDPISGATRYRLQWKSGDQDYAGSRQQDFATATSYTITGLTGGTAYTLRVIVTLGGANEESLEVTASARLPAPGAVTSLILTPQVRGLQVSWTAAQNADGYKVQWRPSDGVYNETDRQSQVDGGAVTAATLSNLDPRVTYAVRVIATREFAADGTAAEATASPSATVPGQVTGLGAAARGTDTIVLTWTAPAEDGGADIEGYRIEVSPDGSDWTELEEDTGSVATGYEHGRLERGTTRHYRVAAINDVGPGPESLPASATTRAVENRAPEFADGAGTEREVAENTGAEEAIGAPVTATDPDDDALTYGLEGADAAAFSLDTDNGQIRTLAALDFETQESYAVTVTVDDLNGGTASIAVTILVADEEEPARRPAAPGVSAVEGEPQQLSVTWTAPDNAGRPDLESYDLRYRVGASGAFTDGPQNLTVTRATLEELEADTGYEVQVRATNADGDGAWSRSGSGVTGAEPNVAPVFEEGDAATRSVAENTVPGEAVGAPLTATDENEDALTYSLEETAEEALFSIDAESGQLLTLEGLDFEAAESHLVTARAADPHGGSAIIAVTVEVIDEEEPPAAPAEPAVTAVAGAVDSLTVSWTEPENTGPPIAGYALQYRVVGEEEFIPGPGDVTGTSTTLEGLSEDTAYEVQVQASNEEGSGPWSSSGVGSVGSSSNATPQFGEGVSAVRSVAENSAPGTAIGAPLTATDADAGDTLTYALEGTDGPSFAIDSQSGQLRTRALLDYEAAAVYTVTVRADDGKGSGRIVVTINVTDRTEPPLAPTPPAVAPLSGSAAGLTVSWTPPANQGRPAITSYDVQYRTGSRGDFAAGPREVTGTSATLDGLARDTSYEVQVRARNADGIGPWSPSGTWPPGDQGSADRTPPRVVRIDSAAEFPTNAVFTVRIEFSERVSGLTLNELEVSNGGAANLLGSGANYTVEVTPASDFEGTVTVTVPADVAQDGAGNGNLAHSAQFAVDTKAPTVQQTTLDAPVTEWTAPLEAGAETAGGLVQYPSNGADGVLATSGVSAGYSAEVRASSGRDTLTLSYAETLDKTSTPPATAFTVRVDAGVRAVATVTVRGQRVRLRLTEPVSRGQTVTLSYRAPLESSATPIRDLAGNVADDLSAESVTDAAAAQERESLHGRVNRELLPYAAAALQASTLDAIANRVHLAGSGTAATGAARASGDTPAGTAGTGTAEPWIVDDGKHRDVRALLRAGTFVLPLGARAPREGATGTLWGSGDYRDLAGSADSEVQWNGALMSLRMGADLHGHGLLGGVAVTWSQGRFDYRDRATGSQREPGEYQTDLLSVHPYAAWLAPGVGANLWMSAGYGWGEVRFGDESSGEQTGLLRLVNGAVGGSLRLLATDALIAGGSTQMRLKGEGSLARVELTENGPFEALALDTRRLRLLLEGSHAQSLPWGGLLTPTLDLGLRYDDGAGPQGEGLELGAKLSYADPRLGLTVQGHGRMLATHRSAHEEWGAGGMLRLELGGAGRGLWLSVAPSWGAAGGSAVGLWQRGVADQRAGAATAAGIEGRLDALAGYGLAAWGAHGLLTPYGGMTLADRVRDYRVGVRLEIDALALSMEGTRYESGADPAAHRAALRVGLQY